MALLRATLPGFLTLLICFNLQPRLEEIAPENSFVLRHYLERAASNMVGTVIVQHLRFAELTLKFEVILFGNASKSDRGIPVKFLMLQNTNQFANKTESDQAQDKLRSK